MSEEEERTTLQHRVKPLIYIYIYVYTERERALELFPLHLLRHYTLTAASTVDVHAQKH